MSLTVRILGPVSIDGPGRPISLSPKLRLILALLAAHRGSVVSVDRLCEALWGDQQPKAAAATLQSHLSRLRRLLVPDGRVVVLDRGYRLDLPEGVLDVDRFTRSAQRASETVDPAEAAKLYASALDWWRGPAFGDLADADWIRPESVRLDEFRLTVVEAWFECRLAAGGDASLIGDLEGFTLTNPFRERFVRQLMVALFRHGRHADALRSASEFRRLVRDGMGLDPSSALTAIEAQVLANDPALLRTPDDALVACNRQPVMDGPTRLVGRSSDLARIADFGGDRYKIKGGAWPEGAVDPAYINPRWIPLTHDGSGNHIGLDMDPWPGGRVGQIILYGRDEDVKTVLAPSLGQLDRWSQSTVRWMSSAPASAGALLPGHSRSALASLPCRRRVALPRPSCGRSPTARSPSCRPRRRLRAP